MYIHIIILPVGLLTQKGYTKESLLIKKKLLELEFEEGQSISL